MVAIGIINVFQICLEITRQLAAQESPNKGHMGGQIINILT